jgi:1-acyl-sn-glycerol-3-phosphate acyltransferase
VSDEVHDPRPEATPEAASLGRDPFTEVVDVDLLDAGLDALERGAGRKAPSAGRDPVRPGARKAPPRARAAGGASRRRQLTIPTRAEVELPETRGWLDRLVGEGDRRVLAALTHLVEGDGSYDRFGFAQGPAILAANHAGLLPFDATMAIVDVATHTDPPRLPRAVVDRWAGSLPWINVFFARMGQVVGTHENCADLLGEGQLLLVFPEGIEGVRKTVAHRYRLQHFRVGFVEHALRARAPIIPAAIVGSDDQAPILYDIKPLARRLGLPVAPITPTFPWLGPLGLLPYPVRYRIVYGEPLKFHERFGAESADDARLVRYLANQVRRSVQHLMDRGRA